jgi:hypothetical protein
MPKRGRPSIMDAQFDQQREKLLNLLKTGVPLGTAAGASRLGRSTVLRALAKGKRQRRGPFREFRDEVEQARDEGVSLLHVALVAKAKQKSPMALLHLLRSIRPADYNPELMARLLEIEQRGHDLDPRDLSVAVRRERRPAAPSAQPDKTEPGSAA